MELYPVADMHSGGVARDGSGIGLVCEWTDGERFMLHLPVPVAEKMLLTLMSVLADADQDPLGIHPQMHVERLLLRRSDKPGTDLLTFRLAGGAEFHLEVPAGRYDDGIPRADLGQ